MKLSVRNLLADAAMPTETCPVCTTCNWEYWGSTANDDLTVTCRTCGRRWERMTINQRVLFAARALARVAKDGTTPEIVRELDGMAVLLHWVEGVDPNMVVTVVTRPGTLADVDDDRPF